MEIKNELDSTLEDSSPSLSTVKKWAAVFKRGRSSIYDDERSGRPKSATTKEIIEKIHNAVLNDGRVKVRELAYITNISIDRVHNILHEHLHMKKVSTRWVPHLLTVDQKLIRMNVSQECLGMFQRNATEFLQRFITVDETLIHYTPEAEASESAPKKAKTVPLARNVMATFLGFAGYGVSRLFARPGPTTDFVQYINDLALLEQLNDAIGLNGLSWKIKKVLYDGHKSNFCHTRILANYFFLFLNMKEWRTKDIRFKYGAHR